MDVKFVDETVKSILRTKFALGLFESMPFFHVYIILEPTWHVLVTDPYPYDDYLSTLRTSETRELLHEMERETIVLLENRSILYILNVLIVRLIEYG